MESAVVATSSRGQASLGPMAAATIVRSGLSEPRSPGMSRAGREGGRGEQGEGRRGIIDWSYAEEYGISNHTLCVCHMTVAQYSKLTM